MLETDEILHANDVRIVSNLRKNVYPTSFPPSSITQSTFICVAGGSCMHRRTKKNDQGTGVRLLSGLIAGNKKKKKCLLQEQ